MKNQSHIKCSAAHTCNNKEKSSRIRRRFTYTHIGGEKYQWYIFQRQFSSLKFPPGTLNIEKKIWNGFLHFMAISLLCHSCGCHSCIWNCNIVAYQSDTQAEMRLRKIPRKNFANDIWVEYKYTGRSISSSFLFRLFTANTQCSMYRRRCANRFILLIPNNAFTISIYIILCFIYFSTVI